MQRLEISERAMAIAHWARAMSLAAGDAAAASAFVEEPGHD